VLGGSWQQGDETVHHPAHLPLSLAPAEVDVWKRTVEALYVLPFEPSAICLEKTAIVDPFPSFPRGLIPFRSPPLRILVVALWVQCCPFLGHLQQLVKYLDRHWLAVLAPWLVGTSIIAVTPLRES
jgi:hypothetical protein